MTSALTENELLAIAEKVTQHKFVYDDKLKINPNGWNNKNNEIFYRPEVYETASEYPSLQEFSYFSAVAYFDHVDPHEAFNFLNTTNFPNPLKINQVPLVIPEGFKFLASAKNTEKLNGYFGVAYVNKQKRQIIVAHRGTHIWNFGSLWADGKGVFMNTYASQIPSALTFTHKVAKLAMDTHFEVFYTGHSLGAWLAQIVTFSHLYFTINAETNHFHGQLTEPPVMRGCYSVVFDSPGAYEILFALKNKMFPQHLETTQNINLEQLPVEVYLFHPNIVNYINFQVGCVSMLNIEKVGVNTNYSLGTGMATHGINPVARLLQEVCEVNAIKSKVIDYRHRKRDVLRNIWNLESSTMPWKPNIFPTYFFNKDEQEFLNDEKYLSDGGFQGINYLQETAANQILICRNDTGKNSGLTVDCGACARQLFISRVRQTVRNIKRGVLWWNPNIQFLPPNYIERRAEFYNTVQKHSAGIDYYKSLLVEAVEDNTKLLLLVDAPGMGKSVALTKLEMELRERFNESLRVVIRLNLNQVTLVLDELSNKQNKSGLFEFLETFCPYIQLVNLRKEINSIKSLPVFILLDALDEVFPLYEDVMNKILHNLVFEVVEKATSSNVLFVKKVILTTRPHLQSLVERAFNVNELKLVPLEFEEQVVFVEKEVNLPSKETIKALKALPMATLSLISNPLMLNLYANILKSNIQLSENSVLDGLELYSRFLDKKHELYVIEKCEADISKMTTKRMIKNMLESNRKFYYFCAIKEIVGSLWETTPINTHGVNLWELWLLEPNKEELVDLISYGVIVKDQTVHFKHRSFAEYFYAILLTQKDIPRDLRDRLFGTMYENSSHNNIEEFVQNMLVKRRNEIRLSQNSEMSFPPNGFKLNAEILSENESSLLVEKPRLLLLSKFWLDKIPSCNTQVFAYYLGARLFQRPQGAGPRIDFRIKDSKYPEHELVGAEGDKLEALHNFLNGQLFPLLCGDTIFRLLDYTDPEIINVILQEGYFVDNFVMWIYSNADPSWARQTVFQMTKESEEGNSIAQSNLITAIVLRRLEKYISRIVSKEEIFHGLISCDELIKCACIMCEDKTVNEILSTCGLIEQHVKKCMMKYSKDLISEVVRNFNLSWWFAEVLSKAELNSLLTNPSTGEVDLQKAKEMETLQRAFGDWLFPSEYKLVHLSQMFLNANMMTSFVLCEFDKQCLGEILDIHAGHLCALYKKFMSGSKYFLNCSEQLEGIQNLEKGVSRRFCTKECDETSPNLLKNHFQLLKNLVKEILRVHIKNGINGNCGENCGWNDSKDSLCLQMLPYAIKYGGSEEEVMGIIKFLQQNTTKKYLKYKDWKCFVSSLVLLVVRSQFETQFTECLKSLRIFIKSVSASQGFKQILNVFEISTDTEILNCFVSKVSGLLWDDLAVYKLPVGEMIVALLGKNCKGQTPGMNGNIKAWGLIIQNIIDSTCCCAVLDVLMQTSVLLSHETLRKTLTSINIFEDLHIHRKYKESCWAEKHSDSCRLRGVINFCLNIFEEDFSWINLVHSNGSFKQSLVEVMLILENKEGYVCRTKCQEVPEGICSSKSSEVQLNLMNHLQQILVTSNLKSLPTLLDQFRYRTEMEWEILLDKLQMHQTISGSLILGTSEGRTHIYSNRLTPLLIVWARRFGKESTRISADEADLWKSIYDSTGQLLHVAIDIGSIVGVKALAWPGHILWKNSKDKTSLIVAKEAGIKGSEIAEYLEGKYKCAKILH